MVLSVIPVALPDESKFNQVPNSSQAKLRNIWVKNKMVTHRSNPFTNEVDEGSFLVQSTNICSMDMEKLNYHLYCCSATDLLCLHLAWQIIDLSNFRLSLSSLDLIWRRVWKLIELLLDIELRLRIIFHWGTPTSCLAHHFMLKTNISTCRKNVLSINRGFTIYNSSWII